MKFFTIDDGRNYQLEFDDAGRALRTTQDILLGPGMTATIEAPYTLVIPHKYIFALSPACSSLRVSPNFIRGQRQGPFWLYNSDETAVAIPAGSPIILFSLVQDVWFDMVEVTL